MFDKLVESTKSKQDRHGGRYFIVTTAIYALALVALAVGTVIGFRPALAEEYSLYSMLTPPVPSTPAPPSVMQHVNRVDVPVNIFRPPTQPPHEILPPDVAARVDVRPNNQASDYAGMIPCNGCSAKTGITGGRTDGDPVPPPPEAKPKPTPDPTPTPEIKPLGTTKVSEGVLQGGATHKQKPAYPAIAKAARASGPVQVVVTISEEGRVIEAYAASGNPLLRAAAVEAARQWAFSPTTLSKVPVKVQGMLTFNFVLE